MEEGTNIEETVVIAIGLEGSGCSSLGNLLAKEQLYPASCDLRSKTRAPVVKQHLRWRGSGLHMIYIDTMGFGRKEDLTTYLNLKNALSTVGHTNAILLVVSSMMVDVDDLNQLFAALDLLAAQFQENIFENVALVFTRWRYDEGRRTEESKCMVEKVKDIVHRRYNLSSYLPTFFIDNYAKDDCTDLSQALESFELFIANASKIAIKS